ncbi:cell division protein FtsA, partial [Chloroflexota bacterium]
AYIGFSGKHIGSLNNRVAVNINRDDHLVTPAALRRGLTSIRQIVLPQDRLMLRTIPRRYFLDGLAGIKNPLGMHGFRLDLEAHIVTAGVVHTQNIGMCLQVAGVGIEELVANPIASAEAVLEPEDKEAGVILADIGGGTTDIAVLGEGSIWHTSVLPVGGIQVTKDIASGLGIPFSVAEELKVKYGALIPEGEGWTETINLETEKYSVSQADLCYIIRARIEEILRMILLEIPRSEYTPVTMVLTGGTAKLSGIEEYAQQLVGLSVRVESPKGLPQTAEKLNDPIYTSSIGLLLWGANQAEGEEEERVTLTDGLGRFYSDLISTIRSIWSRRPRIKIESSR